MQKINLFSVLLSVTIFIFGCKSTKEETPAAEPELAAQTPVTVVTVKTGPLTEYVELNATATFLQTSIVKASSNGYIQSVNTLPGQFVKTGKVLFTLQTKEAKNIGGLINNLDSNFRFSGMTSIRGSQTGYITQLNHQPGDYVQDGEQLAVISTENSFGFILNVPYDLRQFVSVNKSVEVDLPDGTKLTGTVVSILPAVDSISQTQRVLIRASSKSPIPENLIVRVRIEKIKKDSVVVLPKEAVLSNESQSGFWVMKLIDSATAIKVPVTKGLETEGKVEILQPVFTDSDRIIVTGNYGLADTAKVKIVTPE